MSNIHPNHWIEQEGPVLWSPRSQSSWLLFMKIQERCCISGSINHETRYDR